MSLYKKFIQFAMGNGIVLIIGFISSPIITRIISPEEMGKFSMFNTITNLLLLIVLLGIDQSYVRYYYEENEKNRGKLLINCVRIPLSITLLLGVIILIFYKPISEYIIEEQSLLISALIVIHIVGSIFSRFSLLQIRMKQRAKLYSFLNVFMKIVYLILVGVLFIQYRNNYMTLILATVISNIIMTSVAITLERKEWFNISKATVLRTKSKELIKYGAPFIFSMAVTWIFQSIDRVAIKEFCGYSELGLYSGAMNIIALLNACQGAFTTFWVPVAYERYSSNPNDKEFFTKVNKIVTFFMLVIAIGLITVKDIVVLLLGNEYRQAMFIFPYLVFMPIMYTISETTVLGINFKKKTKCHIYIAVIAAIFNIIGNIILVPKYGAIGASVSTGLAYIVFFIARTILSNKYYKVNYNLTRFTIATISTYILATYSSFYRFNNIIVILSLVSMIIICILYKDILKEILNFVKIKFRIINR